MNLPNLITLSRIPLMFVIVALMYCEWAGAATAAFALFLVAAAGDWLDGYLARRRGWITTFGKLMDALTDKIMVMGLVIAFVGSPQFSDRPRRQIAVALALITLCREFLVTGMRMVAASLAISWNSGESISVRWISSASASGLSRSSTPCEPKSGEQLAQIAPIAVAASITIIVSGMLGA